MMSSLKSYLNHTTFSNWFYVCILLYVVAYFCVRGLAWYTTNDSTLSPRKLVTNGFNSWILPMTLHSLVMIGWFAWLFYKLFKQKQLSAEWIYLAPMLMFVFIDLAFLATISKKKQKILPKLP